MNTPTQYPKIVTFLLLALSLFGLTGALADDYEQPAMLKASEILGDKLRYSEYHRVDEQVRSDGYLNYYVLRSDYGDWEVTSTSLLAIRVREVEALVTLDDVSKTEVFLEAAADAGVGQLKTVKQFATHPVESVKGIPSGIGRMFKRYKRQAGDAVDATKEFVADDDEEEGESPDGEEEDSDSNMAVDLTEGYFGVSSAQRAWAQELGTDPYTRNETLQAAIKQVAWADRLGRFGMKFASIPKIPGADVIGEVNDVVWSKDPYELEDINRARLAETGADEELIEAYLKSPHFSPTQLTYVAAAIAEMEGVKGRDGILQQALALDSEAQVGFFMKSVTMLAWYHINQKPISSVLTYAAIPVGVTADGGAAMLFAVDHVYWTEGIATAARNHAARGTSDQGGEHEIWLLGSASERAKTELSELGFTVHENVAAMMVAPSS